MALILIMDSTTTICSISLIYKKFLLKNITFSPRKFLHINIIHLIIINLLKSCNLASIYLKALAFNFGPGSYTSIKIGFAASLGLVYGLNIKLIYFNYPEFVNFTNNSIILIKDNRKTISTSCIIKNKLFVNLKKNMIYNLLKSKIIKQIYLFDSKRNPVKYKKKVIGLGNKEYININRFKLNTKIFISKICLKIKQNIKNEKTILTKYFYKK
ncbi:hypothetical protein ONB76_00025 [Candidatus Karelsulcia muelleri]|uniref:N6-L-threonylcarbamoyladenine synthase, TsaB subunit n=1 Tax=Candidatus Karelsulcia muelleri TaxID=336810 RepID=A0A346E0Q9_9FLAO|nr:hypothetical protein [Candidatus Karelsulcia muelleri]AXN02564.1 N6-L-threonylcarbamoyladenine synthase, TsaB subunit [Candidatus Karelsulcia muelleri]WDI79506.1 hypothetical protein ONB75_00650 [Candidatus Karelsulcia muelleri]WDR78964.1 hypothetical protein ONB76_00025 [Candidatus Karelsulcia muelleri]